MSVYAGQRVQFESTSAHDDGVHAYLVQKFPENQEKFEGLFGSE